MAETRHAIEKLNGANYASYQMRVVLTECDLWSTINPGENKPAGNTAERDKREYILRQRKTPANLALSICDEQQMHIRQLSTAKLVWEEL